MRFLQIDQITQLEAGSHIEAIKKVTGKEDYLRDHFPRFAVLPGVLMLEALFQASALLVRATENHEVGLVVLRAVKNVKFADFLAPGQSMHLHSKIFKSDAGKYTLKAEGKKADSTCVSGRLVLEVVEGDQPEIVAKHAALYMKQLSEQLQQTPIASS